MRKLSFVMIVALITSVSEVLPPRSQAGVYNLHLVTDNGPDYTDIDSFVRTATERWKTPQEKCIAIWRWGRRSRRQTSCAHDDGRLIWDPILHYNSYGTMNCGVISALNIAGFLQLGYRARYIQLGDHTVSEVSWDGGKSWHLFDSSMSFFRSDYFRPLKGRDPDDHHGLNNIRGNGVWVFQPDLGGADCRKLFHDDQGIETRGQGGAGPNLHPERPRQPASVVFKVSAANVITSMRIEADGLRAAADDVLRVLVSPTAGIRWTPVWQSQGTGPQQIRVPLRDEVAGVTECLVKVEMWAAGKKTDVGLDRLKLTTITQLNRRTLPKLTLGTNRVRLLADEQMESTVLWPPLHVGSTNRCCTRLPARRRRRLPAERTSSACSSTDVAALRLITWQASRTC